jgi:phage terminase large subunit GpA-like protein
MEYEIHIEDGTKRKCPHCGAIYAIENDKETLYRNITLMHEEKNTHAKKAKCKQCKCIIKIA